MLPREGFIPFGEEDSIICDAFKKKINKIIRYSYKSVVFIRCVLISQHLHLLNIPVGDRFSLFSFMSFKRCAM